MQQVSLCSLLRVDRAGDKRAADMHQVYVGKAKAADLHKEYVGKARAADQKYFGARDGIVGPVE